MAASRHTCDTHASYNAVLLVWGSLMSVSVADVSGVKAGNSDTIRRTDNVH